MNKKRWIAGFFALMLAFSLTACGGGKGGESASSKKAEEVKAQDLKTIADRLQKEIKYDDELSEMAADMFDILYAGFPADKVKDKIIFLSSSGGTAEEIACFEAVDEASVGDLKKGLEDRLTFQRASFKNYVPAEVKRIDKAVLKTVGNYVVLSISNEPDKAEDIIEGK